LDILFPLPDDDGVALGEGDPDWRRALGAALRKLRAERGLSQQDVAERLPIDRGYLSHLENGKHDMGFGLAIRMCKFYEISPVELSLKIEDAFYNKPKKPKKKTR